MMGADIHSVEWLVLMALCPFWEVWCYGGRSERVSSLRGSL